jgi:hypothetical protein
MSNGEARGEAAHVEHQTETSELRRGGRKATGLNPMGSARAALCKWAERAAVTPAASKVQAMARRIAIDEMILSQNHDENVMEQAQQIQMAAIAMTTEYPSETMGDLAFKLAALHQMMASNTSSSYPLQRLQLAMVGSLLADAVLLQAGPMALPAECREPIVTPEDVERWRLRAVEMDARL